MGYTSETSMQFGRNSTTEKSGCIFCTIWLGGFVER
jgi:hypothetical protein